MTLDVTQAAGLLWLAAAGGPGSAAAVQCTVPKAPVVQILTESADIQYDFNQTSAQLSAQQSNTVNPYAANVDTATGGLRLDQPKISMAVKWGTLTYPSLQVTCFWYDTVTVKIALAPRIFVAKEFGAEPCRSAVVEHELKHVTVDREVMNAYANNVGRTVQDAVNKAGAMGPYNIHETQPVQKMLIQNIEGALSSHELMLYKEMRARQAQVDTLAEYERVGKICESARKKK